MPVNILNLPQYRVLRVEETDHDYHVTAEPVDVSSSCPHCQSDRLISWGTRQQVFRYSFEALRAKILFTEGIHSRKQARPKFERKRAPEPVEMSRALPDDAMGYGLPVLEKMRAMKPPKKADQHKAPPPPKNYGADISTLIRMIEAGSFDPVSTHFYE